MTAEQRTMLTEALGLLNSARTLADAVYEQNEQTAERLPPGTERSEVLDREFSMLTMILGDTEAAANYILELLGYPRLPSWPRSLGPRRFS